VSAVTVDKRAKAGITTVGTITHRGSIITIAGWTLIRCLRGCNCHQHPQTRTISLKQGASGQVGLAKYRVCDCCEPWTWQELEGFLTDLAAIEELPTAEGQLS
jgi:hypothetical protein